MRTIGKKIQEKFEKLGCPIVSPYMLSYLCLIVTHDLILLLYKIQSFEMSDLDFDLSRSFKVNCDGVIGLSIYVFLLIYMSSRSISHRLAVIATRNVFCHLLSLGPNYEKSKVHRMTSK